MQSKATTVAEYLKAMPADRRAEIDKVRKVILENLDADYEEGMQYGMIGYYVPHRILPQGYHCDRSKPLPFAGLASQKGYNSLYLMSVYGDAEHAKWFHQAWAKTGKKLDMGKACIRFKKADDLALDVVGEVFRRVPAARYVERYLITLATMKSRPPKAARPARAKAASAKSRVNKKG